MASFMFQGYKKRSSSHVAIQKCFKYYLSGEREDESDADNDECLDLCDDLSCDLDLWSSVFLLDLSGMESTSDKLWNKMFYRVNF